MKQIYLLFVAVFAIQTAQSQIINIPDANFKYSLTNRNCVDSDLNGQVDSNADLNNDGEIQESEALVVRSLDLRSDNISSLEGLEYFTNLEYLKCEYNQLTSFDVSSLTNLIELRCGKNNLTSLNLGSHTNLKVLYCDENLLTSLDLSQLPNLEWLYCYNNLLTAINTTQLPNLTRLFCGNNNLTSLNVSFNNALTFLDCGNNPIGDLEITNLTQLTILNCSGNQLTSLNIQNNTELVSLYCLNNELSSINLANNTNLSLLHCQQNQLTSLDLSNNIDLAFLYCNDNLLTTLDTDNNANLRRIYCQNNQLINLDISNNPSVEELDCSNNKLISLNTKNGRLNYNGMIDVPTDEEVFKFNLNPTLKYVCSDDEVFFSYSNTFIESDYIRYYINGWGYDCVVNSYCSFVPGGEFFTIQGETRLDTNSNGCDINDNRYPHLVFEITNGSTTRNAISNASGNYSIPVQGGTNTLTPVLENTNYFTISPSSVIVNFPTETSPFIQDFCISPNGSYNDLEVSVLPIDQARPGFDTRYKIFYKNKGTTTLSGTVDLSFQDDLMDLVSSNPIADTQSLNNLSWNYSNLLPFESREILVNMNLNTPTDTPPLNGNDRLGFTTTVNPVAGDETMEDNAFELSQLVVNSYDPNDKTCLEGNTITPDLIGEYVNYLIRFENTGSANAINVVVKDIIDTAKLDVSTLFLTDSSHDLVTRINGNKVEFIFENINLPFDDANNDGYIAFKIKTLNTLIEGDTFENDAEIYFDYNFPIQTNVAQTSIESPLSTDDFELSGFEVYPNPSQNTLFIKGLDAIKSVSIYDMSGRLVNEVSLIGTRNNIEISTEKLGQGAYFVKVKTEVGEFVKKVVKE